MAEGRHGESPREHAVVHEAQQTLTHLREALAAGDFANAETFADAVDAVLTDLRAQLSPVPTEALNNEAGFYSPGDALLVTLIVIRNELRTIDTGKVERVRIMVDQANQLLTHSVRIREARVSRGMFGGQTIEEFEIPNLVEIRPEETKPETYSKFEKCFGNFMARRKGGEVIAEADVKLLDEAATACAELFSQLPEEKQGSRRAPTAHWLVSTYIFLLREHCRRALGKRMPMVKELRALASSIDGIFHTTSRNQIDVQLQPSAVHAPQFVPPPRGPLYRTIRR